MKNQYSPGNTIDIASSPYALSSGDGCQVGTAMFGVAAYDSLISTPNTLAINGAFTMKAVALQAWVVGDPIYWDNAAKLCTNVVTATKCIGVAIAAKANGAAATTGIVRLNGTMIGAV